MPMNLFILSGQSSMERLDPTISFIPTVNAEFGEGNVTVIKTAHSGHPIRRWYKDWRAANGSRINFRGPRREMLVENWNIVLRLLQQATNRKGFNTNGAYYEEILAIVDAVVLGRELESVTFVWMQGERDAREGYGAVYEESLSGLHQQLQRDFGRADVNFVIGRISGWDMENKKYPDWTKIREAQVHYAEKTDNAAWIDTDDLNSGIAENGEILENDLHYSVEGYRLLGERFAAAAIELIKHSKKVG